MRREGAGGRLQEDVPGLARLVHLVRGCRPVPEFTVSGGRLVGIGQVCPICGAESPLV